MSWKKALEIMVPKSGGVDSHITYRRKDGSLNDFDQPRDRNGDGKTDSPQDIHGGVDVNYEEGQENPLNTSFPLVSPICSPVSGKVIKTDDGDYNTLTIVDSEGNYHQFLHFSSSNPDLKDGAEIIAGDPIGWMGETGPGTEDVHLHYQIRDKENPNKLIDPEEYHEMRPEDQTRQEFIDDVSGISSLKDPSDNTQVPLRPSSPIPSENVSENQTPYVAADTENDSDYRNYYPGGDSDSANTTLPSKASKAVDRSADGSKIIATDSSLDGSIDKSDISDELDSSIGHEEFEVMSLAEDVLAGSEEFSFIGAEEVSDSQDSGDTDNIESSEIEGPSSQIDDGGQNDSDPGYIVDEAINAAAETIVENNPRDTLGEICDDIADGVKDIANKAEMKVGALIGNVINAGGQVWVDRLAEEQDWSKIEEFSAKVGMATAANGLGNWLVTDSVQIDMSAVSENVIDIGSSMLTDMAWEKVGDQLGMSADEVAQTRAAATILQNLQAGKDIGIDTALTAVGLNDEVGSSSIANQVVEPESSEASTLGAIGGAVGGAIGNVYGPVGGYIGSMLGTVVGNVVGNAIFGSEDKDPQSYAEIIYDEVTGLFEVSRSWGKDGMDGSTGKNLARSVLETLNGTDDTPGLVDRMTGEKGQVANGRYIEPIRIGYNDGKYQIDGQKFRDAGDMIEKAVLKTAQSVQVEDGNPYIQQAIYQTDPAADLNELFKNIKTASEYQTLDMNREAIDALQSKTLLDSVRQPQISSAESNTIADDSIEKSLAEATHSLEGAKKTITEIKTLDQTLSDKIQQLEILESPINNPVSRSSVDEFEIPMIAIPEIRIEETNDLKAEIRLLTNTKNQRTEQFEQDVDPTLQAIAKYQTAVAENEDAAKEIHDLNDQLQSVQNMSFRSLDLDLLKTLSGGTTGSNDTNLFSRLPTGIEERIALLTRTISNNTRNDNVKVYHFDHLKMYHPDQVI